MKQSELNGILEQHKLWLKNHEEGARADLRDANLSNADLRNADLRYADLRNADLRNANLSNADLRNADLRYANLRNADLRYADLRYANLDFSSFSLWCGGLDVGIDNRITTQLLYHLIRNVQYSPFVSVELKSLLCTKELIEQANKFHRAEECGKLKVRR